MFEGWVVEGMSTPEESLFYNRGEAKESAA